MLRVAWTDEQHQVYVYTSPKGHCDILSIYPNMYGGII